jgi:hypothetical protein
MTLDPATREQIVMGHSIHIGGPSQNCVYITLPIKDRGTEGHFVRLDAIGGCTMDPPHTIGGKKTVDMVHLAFSLIMEWFPHIKSLILDDSASFLCELPDGKSYGVNMTHYELFFNQNAYYEGRFGAHIADPVLHPGYQTLKKSFTDPSKKPPIFDFQSPQLNETLGPLYAESNTWKEFAEKIDEIYKGMRGVKKCALVYPWLNSVFHYLNSDTSYSGLKWKIDLNRGTHKIPFKVIKTGGGSGTRRKSLRTRRIEAGKFDIYTIVGPDPEEYNKMDWSEVVAPIKEYFNRHPPKHPYPL